MEQSQIGRVQTGSPLSVETENWGVGVGVEPPGSQGSFSEEVLCQPV